MQGPPSPFGSWAPQRYGALARWLWGGRWIRRALWTHPWPGPPTCAPVRWPGDPRKFLKPWPWIAAGLALLALATQATSPEGTVLWLFPLETGTATLGPFVYRNQYAACIEALLPLVMLQSWRDVPRRWWWVFVTALLTGSVVAAGSRAGTVLCALELLLIPALAAAQGWIGWRGLIKAWGGMALAVPVLVAIVGVDLLWKRLQEPNPYSLRWDLTLSSWQMFKEHPLTGFGLGSWSAAYPQFARFDDGRFVNQAHNDWAQWAAEGGLGLLAGMLTLVASLLRPAWRTIWGVGLLFVFVHALVDYPFQQRPALAAFFFALLGAALGEANRISGSVTIVGREPHAPQELRQV